MGMPDPSKYYVIINQESGTAIDLSGDDQTSIIGFHVHRGENQQWKFEQRQGDGLWTIKNRCHDKYLNVNVNLGNGFTRDAPVIGGDKLGWELRWAGDFEPQHQGWRFIIPGTCQNVDLDNREGTWKDKTRVILWDIWHGKNQVWRLEEVN